MDQVMANQELLKLIENEISLGFTFLRTFNLAGSKEHADQAIGNARTAYDSAVKFFGRIPADSFPDLRAKLSDLADSIRRAE
jgi:hypothetical protein